MRDQKNRKVDQKVQKRAVERTKAPSALKKVSRNGPSPKFRRAEGLSHPKAEPKRVPYPFPVAGIGASAGGLEAFTELLHALPPDPGMAFVLIQHLAPTHQSSLAEILSKATPIPVGEVQHNTHLEPNHVYIIPPNSTMTIEKGVIKLRRGRRVAGAQHSVDSFLQSLAKDRGCQAIGVILSGSGSDGTLGLEAIKGEGGITFAQDESANYESMPRSAIASGCVDFVLPPAKIAEELTRIARHPQVRPLLRELPGEISKEASHFKKVLHLLRLRTGVDFSLYKPPTIQRRISRRMVLNKIPRFAAYLKYLQDHPVEVDALFQDVLINVTSFFRNPEVFDLLKQRAFPALLRNRSPDQPLRVWVLGCSTGQEVYSIAMAFMEHAAQIATQIPLQIFGTDLNESVLDKARAGLYSRNELRDVSPERLHRFFIEEEGGFRICKPIREVCVFATHDVLSDPPFSRMDLLSCRNLMIYLQPVLQKRLLPIFHYALRSHGFLLLGSSEAIGEAGSLFTAEDKARKLYLKQSTAKHPELALPATISLEEYHPQPKNKPALAAELSAELDAQKEADRLVLAQYGPPGVLVNESLQVLQFRGHTGPYLEPAQGRASHSLVQMLREGLLLPVRSALQKARKSHNVVRLENIEFQHDSHRRRVNIEVAPLKKLKDRWFLVLFEPVQAKPAAHQASEPVRSRSALPRDVTTAHGEISRLRSELAATREYLQSVTEQYEAANEELQSSNEEAQSSNEELQSINEELQTTKEELESTNEELTTVNEEMSNRNVELHRTNSDLSNVLSGLQMCIVVLGADLAIRRFTPLAEKILNLVPTDVGRPITNIRPNIDFPDFETAIHDVMTSVRPLEREVQDRAGRWFSLRIFPYKTLENKVDGSVIVLVDIDVLKHSEQRIKAALDYAESIIETVREPLVVLDGGLKVHRANRAYYQVFRASPEETQGLKLSQLGGGHWNIIELTRRLREVLPENSSFSDFEIERDFERIGHRTMLLSARPLLGEGACILLAIDDVTERKQLEVIRESEQRFRTLAETLPQLVWTSLVDGTCDYFNSKWAEYTGVPVSKLLGLGWRETVHQDDRHRTHDFWCAALRGEVPYDLEYRVRRKDGVYHWFKVRATPLRDNTGTIIKWFGTCTDIEDQKEAQRQIQQTGERLKLLSDTAAQLLESNEPPAAIQHIFEQIQKHLPVDVYLNYLVAPNQKGLLLHSFTGIPPNAAREIASLAFGQYVSGTVAADHQPRVFADLQDSTSPLVTFVKDLGIRAYACQPLLAEGRLLGTLSFGSRTKSAFEPGELDFFRTISDYIAIATDRWRLLNEVTRRAQELEERVRDRTRELRSMVEELEAFSYSVSHDLRSPLRAMQGFATLALDKGGPELPPTTKDYLERIVAASRRADELVRDVLTYSRISRTALNLIPINVEKILDQIIAATEQVQPPKANLEIAKPLLPVMGHEASLTQCLSNLLTNATKFVLPGTVPHIKIRTERRDGRVRIWVEDNGIGIDPANWNRIFGIFERVHSSQQYEGTGIGLAIVRKGAERMGGSAGVESEPGSGSRFWIELNTVESDEHN